MEITAVVILLPVAAQAVIGSLNLAPMVVEALDNRQLSTPYKNHAMMKMKIVRIQLLKKLRQNIRETTEKQENDDNETPKRVTNQDASKYIAELSCYFMQEGNQGSPLSALDTCADFVQQYYCWTSQRSHWSFVHLELNKLRTVFTSRIGVNTASDYTDDIPSSFKVSIDFQGDPS
uniref:Uncharacterized protein n=2 Tax=Timema TaxID=61471 RepID=A0A7R9FGH9_9NEOP|nr:unnamed protein product [Timema bartmani]CAD7452113.1 unnamed protein product [Timema tahoe]